MAAVWAWVRFLLYVLCWCRFDSCLISESDSLWDRSTFVGVEINMWSDLNHLVYKQYCHIMHVCYNSFSPIFEEYQSVDYTRVEVNYWE